MEKLLRLVFRNPTSSDLNRSRMLILTAFVSLSLITKPSCKSISCLSTAYSASLPSAFLPSANLFQTSRNCSRSNVSLARDSSSWMLCAGASSFTSAGRFLSSLSDGSFPVLESLTGRVDRLAREGFFDTAWSDLGVTAGFSCKGSGSECSTDSLLDSSESSSWSSGSDGFTVFVALSSSEAGVTSLFFLPQPVEWRGWWRREF